MQHKPMCIKSPGTSLRPLYFPSCNRPSAQTTRGWTSTPTACGEYRTAWEGRYSLTADVNAITEDGGSAGLAEDLRFSFLKRISRLATFGIYRSGTSKMDSCPTSRRRQAGTFGSSSDGELIASLCRRVPTLAQMWGLPLASWHWVVVVT
jgi:hypothetical protein